MDKKPGKIYLVWPPYFILSIFILLALLIPGGPVENRDFSHLKPAVVWSYNGVLTILGFGSLLLVYFLFLRKKSAYKFALLVGFLYFVLDVLDLFQIFPKSPTPMSPLLLVFEILILLLSLLTMFFSYKALTIREIEGERKDFLPKPIRVIGFVLILVLSIIAITYASLSIMK